ncbi:MAG: hypothetical protein ACLFQV_13095 [Vulcanimicrobiota bacterium]
MENKKPDLKALLCCKDVLKNSRNPSVISIINIFNELRVSKFPLNIETICLVAIYGGAAGEFKHRFEIYEKDQKIGGTPDETFFLENRNSIFHVIAYIDGLGVAEPKHFVIRSLIDGEVDGETTLGIFKPFRPEESED